MTRGQQLIDAFNEADRLQNPTRNLRMSANEANRKAFRGMIAWSEIGPALLKVSNDGYNVCVGSTAAPPIHIKVYN